MKAGWKYKVYTCITCHNKHVKFTMSQFLCSSVKIITKALQGISLLYILYITKWAGILFAIIIHACVLKNRFPCICHEPLWIFNYARPDDRHGICCFQIWKWWPKMASSASEFLWRKIAPIQTYIYIKRDTGIYYLRKKEKYVPYTRTEERNTNSPQEAEKARQKRSKWG